MALRLKRTAISGDKLRELAAGQIERAHALIGKGATDPVSLHEARKALKQLRAFLVLARPALGRPGKSLVTGLREPMRRLARHREMDALLKLLAQQTRVAGSTDLDVFEAAVELHHRVHAVGDRKADLRVAAARLATLGRKVGRGSFETWTVEMVERRFRRSVKKAREAFLAAATTPTTLLLHDWRRRSKRVLNQMRLMQGWGTREFSAVKRDLTGLDDHLGRSRDIGILAGILVGLPAAEVPLQHGVGFRRRLELVGREEARAALDLGMRVYRRRPRTLVERWLA